MAADDPIKVKCPACASSLKVPARFAGKKGTCPKCGGAVLIPKLEESAELDLLIPESDEQVALPTTRRRQARADEELRIPDELDLVPLPPEPEQDDFFPPPADDPDESPEPSPKTGAAAPGAAQRGLARYIHWLLVLALFPLAASIFAGESDLKERWQRTSAGLSAEEEAAIEDLPEDSTLEDLLLILPDQRIQGAHLARDTYLHWGYALLAGLAFFGLVRCFPRGNTDLKSLVVVAVFTATVGIALLLLVQLVADVTEGIIIKGRGIATLIFYVVKFVGFSYRAALDPENGFMPSLFGFTFGVGLCEELCKALPLIWHYRNKGTLDWRAACLWGLASGIGFGISEGVHYSGEFYNGAATGGIYVVRFVSCVALHAIWTAGVGIVISRDPTKVQGGMEWWNSALSILMVLSVAMVLHGLYDTLLKRDMHGVALLCAFGSLGWLGWLIERNMREREALSGAAGESVERS